jgi:hypothetical protein
LIAKLTWICSTRPGSARNVPQLGAQVGDQGDVFADRAAQHPLHVADQVAEVQDLGLGDVTAAEREELLGQLRGPLGGPGDLQQIGRGPPPTRRCWTRRPCRVSMDSSV